MYSLELLLARRILEKFKLDSMYEGNKNIDGTLFCVEDNDDGPGAFRACLDVGLARTSTGARVSAGFTRLAGWDDVTCRPAVSEFIMDYIYPGLNFYL